MQRKKFVIMTDLEGVAGVLTFDDIARAGRYYERSRYLLTGEVNAAVEGILNIIDADIFIIDGHGCGGINYEELHPNTRFVAGKGHLQALDFKQFDALLFVGQHARNGAERAHLNHTMSSNKIVEVTLNGISVGEFGIWAGCVGQWDIPTIFLSGDSAACQEARELVLELVTVPVKEGLEREAAIHLTHSQATDLIKTGVQKAVSNMDQIKPLHFAPNFQLTVEYVDSALAKQVVLAKKAQLLNPRTVSVMYDNYSDVVAFWY